ncbi:MAG: prepilin-type N-terminal cleavage/methylation domain-containing protein [Bdellovibrionales bacterium]|nr:prepilin-type N-terminal cleavage/methylation domain-containing protein [Bdellovibrionales bacterium]
MTHTHTALRIKTGLKRSCLSVASPWENQSGITLVEVLVSSAVMMIILMAFVSMQTNQQTQTKALAEKLEALGLKNLLTQVLADGSTCMRSINSASPNTFDSSSATTIAAAAISVSQIYAAATGVATVATVSSQAAPDSLSLWVDTSANRGIQLRDFQGSGTSYTANWVIKFDNSKLTHPLSALKVPVVLSVDNSNPRATIITGCGSVTAPLSGSLLGYCYESNGHTFGPFVGSNGCQPTLLRAVATCSTPTGGSCQCPVGKVPVVLASFLNNGGSTTTFSCSQP